MPPEADISNEGWSALSDNYRMAEEESSACQESAKGKDNAPTAALGIKEDCQSQPNR
jgi:hypothetical protein